MNRIAVIGIGEDGLDGLGASVRDALGKASVIFGGNRHLAMLPADDGRERISWSKDIKADVERIGELAKEQTVAVLASGDPMMHGIGVQLAARYGAENLRVLPHVSAFSLAAARMGWGLADPMVRCLSVHARPFEAVSRSVQPGMKLLILSRDGSSPAEIATRLTEMGYGRSPMRVLENMGGPQERRVDAAAADGFAVSFDNLNTVAVDCVADTDTVPHTVTPGLPDDVFDHDNTITKRDVRAVTVAALAPKPGDVLWDVGAGNGTVAIEWLRWEPRAYAIAFEHDPERVARIRANADNLGVPELQIVETRFPIDVDAVEPTPDAVFVGGGIAADETLLETCFGFMEPGGRLVANAVTLEAQARLGAAHAAHGGELVRIGIAQADSVGTFTALKPAIDVLQWRVTKT